MYNEQVRDLICPRGPLALRVDAVGDAVVTGLTVHKVTNSSLAVCHRGVGRSLITVFKVLCR